jgi:zinc protease
MTAPHEDPDEIAAWQQRMADEVADRLRTPEAMFGRDVVDVLYQHHLRRSTPDAAAVAAVDPKQALAFYKARFGDASGFTFVIVGSAPLDVLRPLVERYLASLPASGHPPKERDLGIRKIRGVVVKRWKHGTEPKAHVELEFHGDHAWTRQADDDMYTLGEVLRIQLRDVLREARGGVYNVSVLANLGRRPRPSRTVLVKFTCDPARVDELVKATLDAAADLRAHGPSADYIDRVRELYAHQHQKEQFLNAGWLSWLSSAFWYGDDPSLFLDTSHMLARMTPEHVQAAARVFLDPSQYFEGILLPEDAK